MDRAKDTTGHAVDVTVLYRIADPFLVTSKFGFGRGYEDNVVMRFTDPAIKQHLGELRAEEFYRDQRIAKVHDLKKELAEKFRQNGLELADVLIRQYDYPDTFQQLTEQKKIQDQSVLTNRALAKQAEVDTRLKQTAAEGQNSINVRSAEFQAQITGLNAQRDFYERSKHAEADLLVKIRMSAPLPSPIVTRSCLVRVSSGRRCLARAPTSCCGCEKVWPSSTASKDRSTSAKTRLTSAS